MTAKGAPIVGEDGQPRQRRVPLCPLTARFLGPRLVEVPFVATRLKSQRQGHCRILISVLEHMMQQVRDLFVSVLRAGAGPVRLAAFLDKLLAVQPWALNSPVLRLDGCLLELCCCVCAEQIMQQVRVGSCVV